MRASHQADQRATSHRSALDFRFFACSVFRGVCLARRSEATPTCIKTSTRLGAKVIIFSLYRLFFHLNGLIFFIDCDTINVLHKFNIHYANTVFFLSRAKYTFFSHIYIVNLIKMQIPLCRCVNSVLHKFVQQQFGVCVFCALTPVGALFDFIEDFWRTYELR